MPVNNILWEIDPTSEDSSNTPLSLVGTVNGCDMRLHEMDLTAPAVDPVYASSADTEGDPYVGSRHKNRTISLTFVARGTADGALQTAIYQIEQKLEKLRRDGGTLKFTTQAGSVLVGDVNFAQFRPEFTPEMYLTNRAVRFTLDFDCDPYFRGGTILMPDRTETTLPVLTWTETGVVGDVPAVGRLVIDEDQGQNQNWLVWGVEDNAQYDTSASSAALFYEWETRTVLGGAGSSAAQSGASGGTCLEITLDTTYQALVSTQASGAGAHLSHVGNFRVFGRVLAPSANTGTITMAMQWWQGDFRNPTINDATVFPKQSWNNTFRIVDFGLVNVEKVPQGVQRWEGRILAKSTATISVDKLRLDCFWMIPVDRASGEVHALTTTGTPTSFIGRDSFASTSAGGTLNGRVAPTGGTWATSGDATEYLFTDDAPGGFTHSEPIKRATSAGGTTGRFAILGTITSTDVDVSASILHGALALSSGETLNFGIVARYVDASNYVRLYYTEYQRDATHLIHELHMERLVGGTVFDMGSKSGVISSGTSTTNVWYGLELSISGTGVGTGIMKDDSGNTIGSLTGSWTDLATGGALASGKSGLWDFTASAGAMTRYFDEFSVFVPSVDAVIFASQSLEVRGDRVLREDSTGVAWSRPGDYEGDHLRVPVAGKDGRTTRFIVKASRNLPTNLADTAIDDISARLTATPRFLVLGP